MKNKSKRHQTHPPSPAATPRVLHLSLRLARRSTLIASISSTVSTSSPRSGGLELRRHEPGLEEAVKKWARATEWGRSKAELSMLAEDHQFGLVVRQGRVRGPMLEHVRLSLAGSQLI
ncbi:Auxin-responsive protein [Psidium guajava]|nr:Auxin-responsive protein [Psidium guajava]